METETLFTASKWELLQVLENGEQSPIELAEATNTSVANVSQQLRLLEMAKVVTTRRLGNRDKGQPRIMYSLAGKHAFCVVTSEGFVEKELLTIDAWKQALLKIWMTKEQEQDFFEQLLFKLKPSLSTISLVTYKNKQLTIYAKTSPKINSFSINGTKVAVIHKPMTAPPQHIDDQTILFDQR